MRGPCCWHGRSAPPPRRTPAKEVQERGSWQGSRGQRPLAGRGAEPRSRPSQHEIAAERRQHLEVTGLTQIVKQHSHHSRIRPDQTIAAESSRVATINMIKGRPHPILPVDRAPSVMQLEGSSIKRVVVAPVVGRLIVFPADRIVAEVAEQ